MSEAGLNVEIRKDGKPNDPLSSNVGSALVAGP